MLAPEWRYNAQLFTALTRTIQTVGIYLRTEGSFAIVSVGEGSVPVRTATVYKPRRNDGVVLEYRSGSWRIIGPTASRSKLGTVTGIAIPYVTVSCDGRSYRLPITVTYQGVPPAIGDTVAIDWDGGFVSDKVTAAPDDGTGDPVLSTDQKPFTLEFFAKQSGSFRSSTGKYDTTDLLCDSAHTAGWWYGPTIRRSLKDDAYISSVEIYLSLRTRKGEQPKIGRHYDAIRPKDSGPSLNDGAARGWSGWVKLPTAWAEAWRTDDGGVSIGGGNSIYRGIGTDRQSGKLRIRGRQ